MTDTINQKRKEICAQLYLESVFQNQTESWLGTAIQEAFIAGYDSRHGHDVFYNTEADQTEVKI